MDSKRTSSPVVVTPADPSDNVTDAAAQACGTFAQVLDGSSSYYGEFADSLSYLGSLMSAYGVLVTAWVLYNIRIFRKKGPRLGRRQVSVSRTHDYLNQQITKMVNIQQEQEIVVEVSRGQKFFLARPTVVYGPIASGGGR